MDYRKAWLGLGIIALFCAAARAITVNPASSVTADSAATALTIPYRDGSGDFAANVVTLAGLINNGGSQLAQLTTTQLSLRTDPPFTIFISSNIGPGSVPAGLCMSTLAAVGSYVYISTRGTAVGGVTTLGVGSPCR